MVAVHANLVYIKGLFTSKITIISTSSLNHQWLPPPLLLHQLLGTVLVNEATIIAWLQQRKLLITATTCSKCSSQCRFVPKKGTFFWRCPKKGCQAVKSVRDGSYFSMSRLPLRTILKLMYRWSVKDQVSKSVKECGVSQRVVVDWYNFCRDVCSQYFLDHPVLIGGPGKIVEIDESKFGRRKYNRVRVVDGHWVFGGVERGTLRHSRVSYQRWV